MISRARICVIFVSLPSLSFVSNLLGSPELVLLVSLSGVLLVSLAPNFLIVFLNLYLWLSPCVFMPISMLLVLLVLVALALCGTPRFIFYGSQH